MQNPEARIEQSYGFAADLLRLFSDKALDLAICATRPDTVPEVSEFTPILHGRNVVVCPKGHPLLRKRAVPTEEVSATPDRPRSRQPVSRRPQAHAERDGGAGLQDPRTF